MFIGLRTVIYNVEDIETAKKWYSKILGFNPYFDQPFYVGFNVGGYELGLDPNGDEIKKGNNSVAYWGVDDAERALLNLLNLGAIKNTDVQDVGEGIKVATVLDPFGNTLGIIENPHFKLE